MHFYDRRDMSRYLPLHPVFPRSRRYLRQGSVVESLDTACINKSVYRIENIYLEMLRPYDPFPCRLSGSWSTTQAGVKLDMRVVNRTIVVTLSNFTSSRLQESLLNETWNVSGHVPFKRGLPFTLIATHNYTNSIAVFVGMYLVSFANLYLYFFPLPLAGKQFFRFSQQ